MDRSPRSNSFYISPVSASPIEEFEPLTSRLSPKSSSSRSSSKSSHRSNSKSPYLSPAFSRLLPPVYPKKLYRLKIRKSPLSTKKKLIISKPAIVRTKRSTEFRNNVLDKLIENPHSFSKINNTKPRVFPITQTKKKFTYSGPTRKKYTHHSLNPLPASAFKYDYDPVEPAVKNCRDPTLPHNVRRVVAKLPDCDHVILHSNGIHEIRLYSGKSIVINTTNGYGYMGGKKTLKRRSRK